MAKKRPIGRPSKLTPEVERCILKYVRKGNYAQTAARQCGIGDRTLIQWKQRAKQFVKEGIENRYTKFYERLVAAEAQAESGMLEVVRKEPGGDRWLLSRRFREHFGDEISLNIREPVEVVIRYSEEITDNAKQAAPGTGNITEVAEQEEDPSDGQAVGQDYGGSDSGD